MIQIPVLEITEADGVFTFAGPYGMSQSMHGDDIEAEAREPLANYELALKLARVHWWATRQQAADKAAHDATHCRTITWEPTAEVAVSYG